MNRSTMTAVALGLLTISLAPSIRADDSNKETRMTINGPLQVQDILLPPGQYVFRLTEPNNAQSVVSIYNADATRLEGIIIGWSAYRIDAGADKVFAISQPEGDQPAKLQTWFYPGDNSGVEFSVKKVTSETGRAVTSKKKGQTADAVRDASSTRD